LSCPRRSRDTGSGKKPPPSNSPLNKEIIMTQWITDGVLAIMLLWGLVELVKVLRVKPAAKSPSAEQTQFRREEAQAIALGSAVESVGQSDLAHPLNAGEAISHAAESILHAVSHH
jgi:hypothetical protein